MIVQVNCNVNIYGAEYGIVCTVTGIMLYKLLPDKIHHLHFFEAYIKKCTVTTLLWRELTHT